MQNLGDHCFDVDDNINITMDFGCRTVAQDTVYKLK